MTAACNGDGGDALQEAVTDRVDVVELEVGLDALSDELDRGSVGVDLAVHAHVAGRPVIADGDSGGASLAH